MAERREAPKTASQLKGEYERLAEQARRHTVETKKILSDHDKQKLVLVVQREQELGKIMLAKRDAYIAWQEAK